MNSFFKFIVGTVPWITLGILFAMFFPEWMARIAFAGLLIINGWIFWKRVLPVYKESFSNEHEIETTSQTLL